MDVMVRFWKENRICTLPVMAAYAKQDESQPAKKIDYHQTDIQELDRVMKLLLSICSVTKDFSG